MLDTLNLDELQQVVLKKIEARTTTIIFGGLVFITLVAVLFVIISINFVESLTDNNSEKLSEWPYDLLIVLPCFLFIVFFVWALKSFQIYLNWYLIHRFEALFPEHGRFSLWFKLYNICPPITTTLKLMVAWLILGLLNHTIPLLGTLFLYLVGIPWLIISILAGPRFILWAITNPIKRGEAQLALKRAQFLRRLLLNNPLFMYLEADARLACSDIDGAIELLEQLLKLRPSFRVVPITLSLYLLGWAYFTKRQYPEALKAWQMVVSCEPASLLGYNAIATYYCDQHLAPQRVLELGDFALQRIPKGLAPCPNSLDIQTRNSGSPS